MCWMILCFIDRILPILHMPNHAVCLLMFVNIWLLPQIKMYAEEKIFDATVEAYSNLCKIQSPPKSLS